MADYKRMYALLCGAIDDVLDTLENIPQAQEEADRLKAVLLEAEEIYVSEQEIEALGSELKEEFNSSDPDYPRIEHILGRLTDLGEISGNPPISFEEFVKRICQNLKDDKADYEV